MLSQVILSPLSLSLSFFIIKVKLQELYASLKDSNPSFSSGSQFPLPELPGRVLFGRSEVHQVAEKRRVKVEEFCQVCSP